MVLWKLRACRAPEPSRTENVPHRTVPIIFDLSAVRFNVQMARLGTGARQARNFHSTLSKKNRKEKYDTNRIKSQTFSCKCLCYLNVNYVVNFKGRGE